MKQNKIDLYWVGPRLSDIKGIEHLFKGAVTIFGEKMQNPDFYSNSFCNSFPIQINHNDNKYDEAIGSHFEKEFETIIERDNNASFLWYKVTPSSHCSDEVKRRSVYFNENSLDELLSDKLKCRQLMSNYIPIAGTTMKNTVDCNIISLEKQFPGYEEFVLQEPLGASGGFATHVLNEANEKEVLLKLKNKDLLVTPFYKKNIPVNHHIVIYAEEILVFPHSIQLIERIDNKLQYCGGDYVSGQKLDGELQKAIYKQGKRIGLVLQKMGYRGVLGVDYMVLPDGEIAFLEINTRFQASTIVLNQALEEEGLPSIQEYHMESFISSVPSIKKQIEHVDYSIVSYLFADNNALYIKDKIMEYTGKENISYVPDGDFLDKVLDNNSFLFRLIINSNISSVFDGSVIHHPNIFSNDICLNSDKTPENLLKLKTGLLVHGVRMDVTIIPENLKKAVGSAFDLIVDDKLYVNTYVNLKYSSLSPFTLKWNSGNEFGLFYMNRLITYVKIDYNDKYSANRTSNNIEYYSVAQFFTDRLRIHPFPTCIYGTEKSNACRFCDLGNCTQPSTGYELEDIFEVIDFYIKCDLPIRHFLIGGGTALGEKSWNRINDIVRHIRQQTDREIYLMSVPPPANVLDDLHAVGINETGFNIELFDREYARLVMPLKGRITINEYYDTFKYSTKLWGKTGNVRSLLMVGIEPIESTLAGVEELCKRGVMPILSLFRPLPGTPMEDMTPLNYEQVRELWDKSIRICEKYNSVLGPKCIPCQNNTLSFPNDY